MFFCCRRSPPTPPSQSPVRPDATTVFIYGLSPRRIALVCGLPRTNRTSPSVSERVDYLNQKLLGLAQSCLVDCEVQHPLLAASQNKLLGLAQSCLVDCEVQHPLLAASQNWVDYLNQQLLGLAQSCLVDCEVQHPLLAASQNKLLGLAQSCLVDCEVQHPLLAASQNVCCVVLAQHRRE
ncbi:hypothetical protein J6590_044106 [Homalodisca vitripennis]|nr:hypothetical protein J6590_044106 [Homalodisca vitripennis]